jgi:hypothetical protein
MKRRLITSFLLVCSAIFCGEALTFEIIDLYKIHPVSGGHLDLYESQTDPDLTHEVWLYTDADCEEISWTLGGQTHSEPLSCGRTSGFMNIPPGTHYTVIEGCGKRIAAFLTINKDLHLVITPPDLDKADHCPGNEHLDDPHNYYVEGDKPLKSTPLITEL